MTMVAWLNIGEQSKRGKNMMWVADQRKEVGRRWSWSELWDFSYVVETFEPKVFFFFFFV